LQQRERNLKEPHRTAKLERKVRSAGEAARSKEGDDSAHLELEMDDTKQNGVGHRRTSPVAHTGQRGEREHKAQGKPIGAWKEWSAGKKKEGVGRCPPQMTMCFAYSPGMDQKEKDVALSGRTQAPSVEEARAANTGSTKGE
jgi:hypothetical protein